MQFLTDNWKLVLVVALAIAFAPSASFELMLAFIDPVIEGVHELFTTFFYEVL